VKALRRARAALLLLAACSIFARLFLILNIDRSGGVDCIWLRNRPAIDWEETSTAEPAASHAVRIVCGNENGVEGDDLLRWNADTGWWLFSAAALALVAVDARIRRSRNARRAGA
jgi:hypothetical protein